MPLNFLCTCVYDFRMLSAVVTAKAQENCGFPGVAPGRVCPVTANPGTRVAIINPDHATGILAFLLLVQRQGREDTDEASFRAETGRGTASVVPIGSIPMSVAIMVPAIMMTAVVMPPVVVPPAVVAP